MNVRVKLMIVLVLGAWLAINSSSFTGSSAVAQNRLRDFFPGQAEKPTQDTPPTSASPRLRDRLISPFRRVNHEAEEKGVALDMTHGPWLIMCASFISEGKHQAEALCRELRSVGFDAYLYHHTFDHSEQVVGRGYSVKRTEGLVDQYELEPARMRVANPARSEDISVLVGHFSSPESDEKRISDTLDKIRSLYPKSLQVSTTSRSFQRMSGYREWVRAVTDDENVKQQGPMRAAFLVPNPLLPDDFFDRQVADPVVIKMNKGDKYTLLNNPKQYTVKVATFTGDSYFNTNEIAEKTREFNFLKRSGGGLTESRLMEAEANANYLTDLLRKQGWEAYSYHDIDSSIVCVGSFDWVVKNPDSPDKIINPDAQRIMNHFQAKVVNKIPGVPLYEATTFDGPTKKKKIALDLIPVAVSVPRLR